MKTMSYRKYYIVACSCVVLLPVLVLGTIFFTLDENGVSLVHHLKLQWLFLLFLAIVLVSFLAVWLYMETEQYIDQRTRSLLRSNKELAILNHLITSIGPFKDTQGVEKCIKQCRAAMNLDIELQLFPDTAFSCLEYSDSLNSNSKIQGIIHQREDHYVFPVNSGNYFIGQLIVKNPVLSRREKNFLNTLSFAVGIILQNNILLRQTQQKQTFLNAFLEGLCDAATLIDNEQKIIYTNQRMARLTGIPVEVLKGSSEDFLFDILAANLLEPDQPLIAQIRKTKGIFRFKANLNNKNRLIMVSAFDVAGNGRGYLWRDITKEQEVEKLKNDLVSLVSHEFKTPITSITGSVETLLRPDTDWDEEFKLELLHGIHEDIRRIQELVADWLEFSKLEAGAIGLNRTPVHPYNVVDDAMRQLPSYFEKSGVTIENFVDKKLPMVYGDKMRLEQVIGNLLTNAIRYNDRQPHITLNADSDGSFVYFRVKDNGIGVSPLHVNKIFDRFYSIDVASIRRSGGTGLGLALCKGIVEAHGGKIGVESIEGMGSIFSFSIPHYRYKCGNDDE